MPELHAALAQADREIAEAREAQAKREAPAWNLALWEADWLGERALILKQIAMREGR